VDPFVRVQVPTAVLMLISMNDLEFMAENHTPKERVEFLTKRIDETVKKAMKNVETVLENGLKTEPRGTNFNEGRFFGYQSAVMDFKKIRDDKHE
jgi:hypothetical protein